MSRDLVYKIQATFSTNEVKDYDIRAGEPTWIGDFLVGTTINFSEITWGEPTFTLKMLVEGPEQYNKVVPESFDVIAIGIVSDDPELGCIIKLTNEATWKTGELEITKKIIEGDKIYDVDSFSIDEDSEFEVRITDVQSPLKDDVKFPKVGQSIKLNKHNDWTCSSGKVLPKGTVVTFEKVNLRNGAGYDWAKPYYVVGTEGEGEFIYGNEVTITGEDKTDSVEIHNRLIPTAEVDIDKIVTVTEGQRGRERRLFHLPGDLQVGRRRRPGPHLCPERHVAR